MPSCKHSCFRSELGERDALQELCAALKKITDYSGNVHEAGWHFHNIACVALDALEQEAPKPTKTGNKLTLTGRRKQHGRE